VLCAGILTALSIVMPGTERSASRWPPAVVGTTAPVALAVPGNDAKGAGPAWVLAGLFSAALATLALGIPLARRAGDKSQAPAAIPPACHDGQPFAGESVRAPEARAGASGAGASVGTEPGPAGHEAAGAIEPAWSRPARMRALSAAITRLNVLGETLAQSCDAIEQIGGLVGLAREAFAADAAMISLEIGVAPRRETLAGERRLRTVLRGAGEHAIAAGAWAGDAQVASITRPIGIRNAAQVMAAPLESDGVVFGALAVADERPDLRGDGDLALLVMVAGQIETALRSARIVRRLEATNLEMVQALATAMEAKDRYTATHAENIATMAVAVGRHMGLDEGRLRELEYAAVLHDVGKIGVPGHILNKPDQLTALEYARVTQHTAIGERIVSRVAYLRPVARVIRAAHERWDGAGYPDGLIGAEIPLLARILFVCDAYGAMTSDRRYRRAMDDDDALRELTDGAGTQFDPEVVQAFLEVVAAEADERAVGGEAGGRSA
jgi:HD-GYP domain-containing protein (c-di-GMP phosphodiesterase class II)